MTDAGAGGVGRRHRRAERPGGPPGEASARTESDTRADAGGQADAGGKPPASAPEQAAEDTDRSWGQWDAPDDDRVLRERPPHWG